MRTVGRRLPKAASASNLLPRWFLTCPTGGGGSLGPRALAEANLGPSRAAPQRSAFAFLLRTLTVLVEL